ncbi:hypothetical protein GF377_03730 [candidate division GN15 bacterium]|nr:hypothetical protein [candidate division GN15 bacterium]
MPAKESHMKSRTTFLPLTTLLVALVALAWVAQGQKMPFGGNEDISYANKVWSAIDGYRDWSIKSDVYPGKSPHGQYLQSYYSIIAVNGNHHHVIVKENYGGDDITAAKIRESRDNWLKSVTVMVQREKGYDPDNNNWFWVKYLQDGSIAKNPKGMSLAGRVAKGADTGCISCHAMAKGQDFLFSND